MSQPKQAYRTVLSGVVTALACSAVPGLVASCSAPGHAAGANIAAPLERMAMQNEIIARNVERALCPRDLAWVVSQLRRECAAAIKRGATKPALASPTPTDPKLTAPEPPDKGTSCPADAASNIDELAQELLGQGIFKTLQNADHEVLYFEGSKIVWSEDKQDRLSQLIELPPLEQTRFLVLTPSDKGENEADERIAWMQGWLTRHGVPMQRVETPLKYQGNRVLSVGELRPLDRPVKPEPADTARSLWVYRINCR